MVMILMIAADFIGVCRVNNWVFPFVQRIAYRIQRFSSRSSQLIARSSSRVILEEVDELWDEIKKNHQLHDLDAQRKEAKQAAAMLVRLMVELL